MLTLNHIDTGDASILFNNTFALAYSIHCLWVYISGQGHVAYPIKENHKCSNMVANNMPADHPTPHDPGDWVNRS